MEQNDIKNEQEVLEPVKAEEIVKVIKKEEKKEWMLPASIVFAAIVIAAAFIYASGMETSGPAAVNQALEEKAPEITERDTILGNPNAQVTIVDYGDFQCPYCGKFYNDIEPFIRSEFIDTGKAKIVYKPLSFLGPESEAAAVAVECARDQGKFWEMHDGIFAEEYKEVEKMIAGTIASSEHNGNLNLALFQKIGKGFGLDQTAFTTCFNSGDKDAVIAQHMQDGQDVMGQGLSTPSIYINGKSIEPSVWSNKQALTTLINGLIK
ncbi:MAG: DsbA oxidoreductase [uncultured bacterium]|uniref:DSBA oxidoreductase n=1 Tax=Candidatus Wolfebacteria bacterium GW2011_GWE2_44_13 TaxID=1619017 RepID=A0A0G1H826_9BACT|nr:MAG: DsbA oxidoreductase [uncultured bacterium]KKT43551.1 MAG: DSBA oxidoreductase [Candidatus Wolfebacteria bacterium GW2011_GWE2_44_13]